MFSGYCTQYRRNDPRFIPFIAQQNVGLRSTNISFALAFLIKRIIPFRSHDQFSGRTSLASGEHMARGPLQNPIPCIFFRKLLITANKPICSTSNKQIFISLRISLGIACLTDNCFELFGSHQRLSSAMYTQAGNIDLSTQCEIKRLWLQTIIYLQQTGELPPLKPTCSGG